MACTRILTFNCLINNATKKWYSSAATSIAAQSTFRRFESYRRPVTPVFKIAASFDKRIAIRDDLGEYTYRGILETSAKLSNKINEKMSGNIQERVALLVPNDVNYVIAQWASWISGQIVVPLCPWYPLRVLEYLITDSDSNVVVTVPEYEAIANEIAGRIGSKVMILDEAVRKDAMKKDVITIDEKPKEEELNLEGIGRGVEFYSNSNAMIIYTSGSHSTTLKGTVISHSNLDSQIRCLVKAWEWQQKDCILHALPLHHFHGIVNALLCPLYVGARCVMLKRFKTDDVWIELMGVSQSAVDRVNLFMGVPTMYAKLIEEYERSLMKTDRMKDYIRSTCIQKIRLMVCGSAPLSRRIYDKWELITGHQILERYGTTETGMVLSNPLHGARTRGSVGIPLPGVHVRLVSDDCSKILCEGSSLGTRINVGGEPCIGELEIRSNSVFSQYWRKPNATTKEFTADGWFKTGDIAEYNKGLYWIHGRKTRDIIKTGGYKVSSFQVESVLSEFNLIKDIIIIGVPDDVYGEKVGAIIQLKEDTKISETELINWAKDRLPHYAIPSLIKIVTKFPKTALDKIDREELVKLLSSTNEIKNDIEQQNKSVEISSKKTD